MHDIVSLPYPILTYRSSFELELRDRALLNGYKQLDGNFGSSGRV